MAKYREPSETMKVFIAAAEERREAISISRAELARRVGINATQMSQILNGNGGNANTETLDKISHALGTTTITLITDYATSHVN